MSSTHTIRFAHTLSKTARHGLSTQYFDTFSTGDRPEIGFSRANGIGVDWVHLSDFGLYETNRIHGRKPVAVDVVL